MIAAEHLGGLESRICRTARSWGTLGAECSLRATGCTLQRPSSMIHNNSSTNTLTMFKLLNLGECILRLEGSCKFETSVKV